MIDADLRRERADRFPMFEWAAGLVMLTIATGLLYPVIVGERRSGETRTLQDVHSIAHAIDQYATEYGQLPAVGNQNSATGHQVRDTAVGDSAAGMTDDNAGLFDILRDIDRGPNAAHAQNARRVVFIEGRVSADASQPPMGFVDDPGRKGVLGAFYDRWGSQYNVVIDSNLDGVIDVGNFYRDFAGEAAPRVRVGVFSLGKDRLLGTHGDRQYRRGMQVSDDVITWASH